MFEPARPINPSDYKKKTEDQKQYKLPLTDTEYYEEYQEYKKNRLETYKRIDTYEILDEYRKSKELNEKLKQDQKSELDKFFKDKGAMRFE